MKRKESKGKTDTRVHKGRVGKERCSKGQGGRRKGKDVVKIKEEKK